MKNYMTRVIVLLACLTLALGCQQGSTEMQSEQQYQALLVEAACGECQFGLTGSGCDLAVRIDGKAYFVDGTKIDDHGDAHSDDGFCNVVRQARVHGRVDNGRFIATSFELLPGNSE